MFFLASIYEQVQKILPAAGCTRLINLEMAVEGDRALALINGDTKWQPTFGLKVLFCVLKNIKSLKLNGLRNGKCCSLFR